MSALYLHHATLHTPTEIILDGALVIREGRIEALGADVPCPPDAQSIDATGYHLTPGFLDLQLNGAYGLDFTADPTTIWQVAARLPQYGVTGFLPTIITSPFEVSAAAQQVLQAGPPKNFAGATPLGLHLEGPFLNPQKRGAHNPNHLRAPDVEASAHWSRDEYVWLVTLAPELPEARALVKALSARGIVVSAGHSMATYAEAEAAFDIGVRYGTHLFNAMPPLDHRAPGLAGALMYDPRPIAGLIPDGIHVHPALVAVAARAKGHARINVVTDAMAALGMPPGTYRLGDFDVIVDAVSARLSDGRLAGSILSLDQALRNYIAYTSCTLAEALSTITTVPADLLGLPDRGRLQVGARADVVLLTADLQVAATFVKGELCYTSIPHWKKITPH